jgi:AraC family transcriptional regulator, regulatory protein of adaptative response / methylated-DNA-[protein]-cysteine methyltransferase
MQRYNFTRQSDDYRRIEKSIGYLQKNFRMQPDLGHLASQAGLSEFHFQKLFKRWVGISPKRFLQYLTKEYAKTVLRQSRNLLDASYASGLSGPGRLHDLFVQCEAVTPGEFRAAGEGLKINYGFLPTPFGICLLAATARGICGLYFLASAKKERYLHMLRRYWPRAEFHENELQLTPIVRQIFDQDNWNPDRPFRLHLNGTNFQIKVWEALLRIPAGCFLAYEDIAQKIGNPLAARAVGSAIAGNPVSFLIPCHRVIRKEGDSGNYGGGPLRKKILLAWEAARFGPGESRPEF